MTVLQVIHVHNVFDNVAMYVSHYAEKINSDNNNLQTVYSSDVMVVYMES